MHQEGKAPRFYDLCGCVQQHPVSEAIFNFAGAYSFMLLPLFIWDRKSKRKVGMWTAILVGSLQPGTPGTPPAQ